jgi:hypothetical protein
MGRRVVLRNGLLYGAGTWYSPGGSFGPAARAGKLTADADVASFVHVDDDPAPAHGTGPRHPWARGAVNHRARDLGWVPRHPSWRTGF